MFVCGGTGITETMGTKKEESSSFINPSIRSHTVLISSVCSTSQCKYMYVCVMLCVCVCLGRVFVIHLENKSTFGMFHSILKHAEHRTLNTYTEQLVLSKCSFFFFFFFFFKLFSHRVALGYTEHDATNRTRLDILL